MFSFKVDETAYDVIDNKKVLQPINNANITVLNNLKLFIVDQIFDAKYNSEIINFIKEFEKITIYGTELNPLFKVNDIAKLLNYYNFEDCCDIDIFRDKYYVYDIKEGGKLKISPNKVDILTEFGLHRTLFQLDRNPLKKIYRYAMATQFHKIKSSLI